MFLMKFSADLSLKSTHIRMIFYYIVQVFLVIFEKKQT